LTTSDSWEVHAERLCCSAAFGWNSLRDLSWAVSAAKGGDEDSFRLLYRSVQPILLRYLQTLVKDDAEDLASETWLQIARDIRSFDGDYDGFRGWAVTIARHRAMDHIRRQQRRPRTVMSVDDLNTATDGCDTAAQAVDSLATRHAIAMIASLPREQAEAVMLRVVMGLDSGTVGQILGKRAGAVRTAVHRGLRRLTQQIGSQVNAHGKTD
jgi:RNA polymerase sigma-70 factor (ECF subfamily)